MKPLYTAVATAIGGRDGKVESSDGVINLPLKMPKEMGGPGGVATNPEQLFASGYSACFGSALGLVARMQQKPVKGVQITASVTIGQTEDKGFKLAVELRGKIDGVTQPEAQALMEAAHNVCPYSKATRGNIDVKLIAE